MRTALHKTPTIAYPKEAYITLVEEGYALPISTEGKATVLLFRDVEDHIDGNGMAVLWLLEGEGTFLYDGATLALKKGDVVMFDDNVEHGFEAPEYCVAVNFDIDHEKNISASSIAAMLDAFEMQHHHQTASASISSPTPTF